MGTRVLAIACGIACAIGTASAQTILYVNAALQTGANNGASWDDAFQGPLGVQAALTGSAPNTQIWIARGRYTPAPPNGDRTIPFALKSGVALYGGFVGGEQFLNQRDPAVNTTTLSGDLNGNDSGSSNQSDNARHVVRATNVDATAILDGFTIRDGVASGAPSPRENWGANLFLEGGGPTIRDCTITKGTASNSGGGAALDASSPTIDQCNFLANTAQQMGGGIVVYNAGSPLITHCRFDSNIGGSGTGIYVGPYFVNGVLGGIAKVRDCVFINNNGHIGAASGIGMFVDQNPAHVVRCQFVHNTTDSGGGGMYLRNSPSQIVSCDFVANDAPGDGGGGVFVAGSNPPNGPAAFANCRFVGNNGAAFISFNGKANFFDCTFANNCFGFGFLSWPTVQCGTGSPMDLRNCVIWGNQPIGQIGIRGIITGGGQITVDHCCVQLWDGSLPGTGTFAADPLFVNSLGTDGLIGTVDDDVHIQAASPCVDAGLDANRPVDATDIDSDGSTGEPLPMDFDGRPRVMRCHVDIGAFEVVAGVPQSADMNADGQTDLADIAPFADAIMSGAPDCVADVNGDGSIDALDVIAFINCFLAGSCP